VRSLKYTGPDCPRRLQHNGFNGWTAALVILVIINILNIAHAFTDAGDKLALQRVYRASLHGEGSCLDSSQWGNTSSDPCDDAWFGIRFYNGSLGCSGQQGDAARRVLSLQLTRCGVKCRLDAIIISNMESQLSDLRYLFLDGNYLSGTIPPSLSQLREMQVLYLAKNQLNGSISANLSQLSQLQALDLHSNELSGTIPASLGQLVQLQYLYLYDNQLTGSIPASLGRLSKLQVLGMYENPLTGVIPDGLGELAQLQQLDLSRTKLSGSIPASLGQLFHLQQLQLLDNQLSGAIPSSLGQLQQLSLLDLSGNQLNGTLPDSLGMLSQLEELFLNNNCLQGPIPDSFGQLIQLQRLLMGNNQLSGAIPHRLGQLVKLRVLDLGINQLNGTIPDSLGQLVQLEELFLVHNHLSGTIPPALFELSEVRVLALARNALSGPVPPIRNLRHLYSLSLQGQVGAGTSLGLKLPLVYGAAGWFGLSAAELVLCQLQGVTLPHGFLSDLPMMPKLVILGANSTGITGALDVDIATKLPALINLLIHNNRLTGPLPPMPPGLQALIAFNNDFTSLPPLQKLTNLTYFVLDGNRRMEGQLHDDWSGFRRLRVLSAQHCSLSGRVPPGLLRLSLKEQLQAIGLRDNLLRGALVLPTATNTTAVASFAALDLGFNAINGSIPASMAGYLMLLKKLQILRLDHNLLSCGLGGLSRGVGRVLNFSASLLSGNSYKCPVPDAVSILDPAAATYTCDTAPWQLDMLAAGVTSLCCVVLCTVFRQKLYTSCEAVNKALRVPVCVCALSVFALSISLVHWGWLHGSEYECAGAMWGSGTYHRTASGTLLFLTMSALAVVQVLAPSTVDKRARQSPETDCGSTCTDCKTLGGLLPQPNREGNAMPTGTEQACLTTVCRPGAIFFAFVALFVLFNLGLDFLLVILSANAWDLHSSLPVPHLLSVATVATSGLKTVVNAVLMPMAAVRCIAETRSGKEHRSPRRCCKAQLSLDEGAFVCTLQTFLSVILPLLVSMVQLQECFAYLMPWNMPALLPVTYEYEECTLFCSIMTTSSDCRTRAGVPNCAGTQVSSWTIAVDSPPLWRGTCASAGYRLFAPQATLVLAIQAVQVIITAVVQWYSGRTVAELASTASGSALTQARRKGCCVWCFQVPNDRAAWLPQSTRRSTKQKSIGPSFRPVASALEIPLLGHESQHQANSTNSVRYSIAATANSNAQSPPPTFDSIQAHITVLVGGVFGAVYPAACLACAAAVGAYALSWNLAPHAQTGDVPVPLWMRHVMVMVYTLSVWFAYGPGSMLEGDAADSALWALAFLSAQNICMLIWLLARPLICRKLCPPCSGLAVRCGRCSERKSGAVQRGSGD